MPARCITIHSAGARAAALAAALIVSCVGPATAGDGHLRHGQAALGAGAQVPCPAIHCRGARDPRLGQGYRGQSLAVVPASTGPHYYSAPAYFGLGRHTTITHTAPWEPYVDGGSVTEEHGWVAPAVAAPVIVRPSYVARTAFAIHRYRRGYQGH